METKKSLKKKYPPAINLVFIGSALTTLYFNSRLQDPFNSPKMWLLMLLAASLAGYILFFNFGKVNSRYFTLVIGILGAFISSCLIATFASSDIVVSMFGESQRRNGFITYLSLVVLFIALVCYLEYEHLQRLTVILGVTSVLLVIYGFMQYFGNDFVSWNNPYNRVIVTAGNPNFSAAIFAILCTFFSVNFMCNFNKNVSLSTFFSLGISVLLFINILNTQARQGILAYVAGIAIALLLFAYAKNRILGLIVGTLLTFIGFFVVQGVLNSGPLRDFLYKETVSIRGYYWRTGIEMFKANPLTGVGLDNYGGFFNFYRDVSFPLKYGFEVMSNNAHNTFIQMFATGGIFVGTSYIVLQMAIAFVALKALKVCERERQKQLIVLFASWITFQAQSLVSIDNIAISIWGWVFGAALFGLSIKEFSRNTSGKTYPNSKKEPQIIITSFVTFLTALVFCSFLYRAETNMYFLRSIYSSQVNQQVDNRLLPSAQKMLELPFLDAEYQAQVGFYLATSGYLDEGLKVLKDNIEKHPNSNNSFNIIANIYESVGQPKEAIAYRLVIRKMNPWNAKNLLQLGKNYKALQDYDNMEKQLTNIESFARDTDVYFDAKQELVRN
jgi:O-antigen ligase